MAVDNKVILLPILFKTHIVAFTIHKYIHAFIIYLNGIYIVTCSLFM